MIIVQLMGGLGNQMFQYAMARRLAYKQNTKLLVDLSLFEITNELNTPRIFELHHFNIVAEVADQKLIRHLDRDRRIKPLPLLKRLFRRSQQTCSLSSVVHEPHYHFSPEMLHLSDNCYLIGYWQSEKYFLDVADLIRKEFSVKNPPQGINLRLLDKIDNCNSISLHVRRGDYITDKQANVFHGVCSLEYYQKAILAMAERVDDPHFFIFSDDPDWTKEHLHIGFPVSYISHNGPLKGHEDLRLMRSCKHNILANSSFSWWGAWLNSNPEKEVIAPALWFKAHSADTSDLIPSTWSRL